MGMNGRHRVEAVCLDCLIRNFLPTTTASKRGDKTAESNRLASRRSLNGAETKCNVIKEQREALVVVQRGARVA